MTMDELERFKVVCGVVVWTQAMLGGIAPLCTNSGGAKTTATSLLNMLAAGIFLAASTMHLLPDAQENQELQQMGCLASGKCFRLANFFYVVGFLLVLLLETSAHSLEHLFEHKTSEHRHEHAHDHGHVHESLPLLESQVVQAKPLRSLFKQDSEDLTTTYGIERIQHPCTPTGTTSVDGAVCMDIHEAHSHLPTMAQSNPLISLVVLMALSFHSVMEGLGIGAANRPVYNLLGAVMAHKMLAAFALALELAHQGIRGERLFGMVALFALMTPIGILLGSVFVDAHHQTAASGVCTALAGGTFLYIAVMETIPHELHNQHAIAGKCTALLLGYGCMSLISIWT